MNIWGGTPAGSQGPPAYQTKPDSVLDMKRELQEAAAVSTSEDTTSTSGSDVQRDNEYQTMDRSLYDTSTFRPQERALPQVPDTIPSVPGYARPFAHVTNGARPPQPPPPVPGPPPPLETSLDDPRRPMETSFDTVERPQRSQSVGHILETNFDEPEESEETTPLDRAHSRSVGDSGLIRLSLAQEQPLESDL